jgi:hypothetical protein
MLPSQTTSPVCLTCVQSSHPTLQKPRAVLKLPCLQQAIQCEQQLELAAMDCYWICMVRRSKHTIYLLQVCWLQAVAVTAQAAAAAGRLLLHHVAVQPSNSFPL